MKKSVTMISSLLLGTVLTLAACSNTPAGSSSSSSSGSSESSSSSSQSSSSSSSSSSQPTTKLATGAFDLSTMPWEEKSNIVAALESYAMSNHSAGIPLYDDASYEQFSSRLTLPSTKYLTNYGFGVGYGTIKGEQMYDGSLQESNEKWRTYFHGYTNTDSGTFNAWDSTGSDVSGRYGMISSSYFGVKANDDNTAYYWEGSLATVDEPIMLEEVNGVLTPVDFTGMTEKEKQSKTSQFFRVPLHTGAGYTYHTAEGSKWASKYDGREVAIEDYITPFRTMLDNRFSRYAELVSDSSGFQGAMEYLYDESKKKQDWDKSGVGVQISPDGEGLDFSFIQAKSISYARTSLSSSLFSPIPQEFLNDIKASEFGKIVSNTDYTKVFDNFLCFGPYIPEYWQQNKEIVFKRNADYFEASDYHFDGYTEVVFTGDHADEDAYDAFLHNQLDEVTIPTKYVEAHKNDANVLHTEGSTVIKLNINSCTEEEWEYYFGEKGTIYPHNEKDYWHVKPIMSNEFFLDGMYFAINRPLYAEMAGRNPAMGYLSNAYMLDPAGEVSYRSSDAGKGVLANYEKAAGANNSGYSKAIAEAYFKRAAQQLLAEDYYEAGDEIEITGIYRYQSTIDNIGKYVAQDIQDTFNNACKSAGINLSLKINLKVGGTSYTDTYTLMDHGEFDFAEGAISGNVLNPLEFMNTMSSTKALNQGFNLNWGHRTDLVSETHPCVYTFQDNGVTKGGRWSFDALWSATQGFTAVDEGMATPIASNEEIIEEGNNIIWQAEFPPTATDDLGRSLYDFSISEFAVVTGNGASMDGGYYHTGAKIVKDDNGYITISIPKSAIQGYANNVASGAGKVQNYFGFYFTLIYSIKLESGTVKKAMQIVPIWSKLVDYGMTPAQPK